VASNTLYIGMDLGLFLGPLFGGLVCDRFDFARMFGAATAPVAAGLLCLAAVLPGYYRRRKSLRG
jgi:predicted MFS family arabinose efflux permease